MNEEIKKLLKPLASLRLTVALLLSAMVLVLAGTTAQRDMGLQDVLHNFFHAGIYSKIYLHYFEPTPKTGHTYHTGNIWFPLPGGYLLIAALLANLLAAHTVRFKFTRKRIGVILTHFGLVLLLVGELVTGGFAVESHMRIDVNGSSNYSSDVRDGHGEFAVIDTSPADHNDVVTVPQKLLEKSLKGQPIHDPRLPFDIKVERWYDNAFLRGPRETGTPSDPIDRLADTGMDQTFGLSPEAKFNGTESASDIPGAFITFSKDGQRLGTYLFTARFDPVIGEDPNPMLRNRPPQQITVGGKTYQLALRFERYYKPYTISLSKFTHDRFLGTDVAKDFASDIRLVDPVHHVDRQARIWMNHPLRYLPTGETFYQADFDHSQDRYTILQVVHNPGWLMPYFACAIGAIGLVIHFGITLVGFLRKKTESRRKALVIEETPVRVPGRSNVYLDSSESRSYRMAPRRRWPGLILPTVVALFAIGYVVHRAYEPAPQSPTFNWNEFGRLPIQFEGRTQPLNSMARNTIQVISGRQTPHNGDGDATPPEQWLLDVMTKAPKFEDYKVFRIDHPQIKDLLGLADTEKLFSWKQIFHDQANIDKIEKQAALSADKADKERDSYDNQILDLKQHLNMYLRLFQVDAISARYEFTRDFDHVKEVYGQIAGALSAADPGFVKKLQSIPPDQTDSFFRQSMASLDLDKLTQTQKQAIIEWLDVTQRTRLLSQLTTGIDLFLGAPDAPGGAWQPLRSAVNGTNDAPRSATDFLKIVKDYSDNKPEDFNTDLATYTARLDRTLPDTMVKMDREIYFNRFDAFTVCMVFYVGVFVLTLVYWLVRIKPIARAAFALLVITLAIHTAGLVFRIYLSGRPPVTNLYSSAVFIAWGLVLFSVGLELIYRNGLALATASVAGFTSLLIAAGLAATEGDTMKQLQAVLDTNFWLATHVVCVTLGYTATFLAGTLAIGYVLAAPGAAAIRLGLRSAGMKNSQFQITPEAHKDMARMVYGIVCFAMLFSFVGTILGGIWADQSWGRFWGWDPKENGAILIVLWNALILHARWGGVVRERGVMVLAILGNIVTSWSWFGTNMLGIGLHSYGFMESAQFALIAFMLSQVALALFGMIPATFWTRIGEEPVAPPPIPALAIR